MPPPDAPRSPSPLTSPWAIALAVAALAAGAVVAGRRLVPSPPSQAPHAPSADVEQMAEAARAIGEGAKRLPAPAASPAASPAGSMGNHPGARRPPEAPLPSALALPEGASAPMLEAACTQGNARACGGLAMKVAEGDGVARDDARARELFTRACDGGDGFGCLGLGRIYASGKGVTADQAEARKLFGRSCQAGSGFGCRVLSLSLRDAQGGPIDLQASAAAARRGCELGDEPSCSL